MIHASTNFSHSVAFRKRDSHVLVTEGVYRQVLLSNLNMANTNIIDSDGSVTLHMQAFSTGLWELKSRSRIPFRL
jgi:hypothetical protein